MSDKNTQCGFLSKLTRIYLIKYFLSFIHTIKYLPYTLLLLMVECALFKIIVFNQLNQMVYFPN